MSKKFSIILRGNTPRGTRVTFEAKHKGPSAWWSASAYSAPVYQWSTTSQCWKAIIQTVKPENFLLCLLFLLGWVVFANIAAAKNYICTLYTQHCSSLWLLGVQRYSLSAGSKYYSGRHFLYQVWNLSQSSINITFSIGRSKYFTANVYSQGVLIAQSLRQKWPNDHCQKPLAAAHKSQYLMFGLAQCFEMLCKAVQISKLT